MSQDCVAAYNDPSFPPPPPSLTYPVLSHPIPGCPTIPKEFLT